MDEELDSEEKCAQMRKVVIDLTLDKDSVPSQNSMFSQVSFK